MLRTVSRLDSEAPSEAISRGVADGCTPEQRVTRALLGYGIVAGPFYVVVSLTQAALREGFDLTRHPWSLLANGPAGWIQIDQPHSDRADGDGGGGRLPPRPPRRDRPALGPVLLAMYGISLIGAGVFRADPMDGFPVGTPAGPPVSPTLSALLHLVFGGVGFLAMIARPSCWPADFRQRGTTRPGRGQYRHRRGLLGGFVGIASGSGSPAVNLAFTAAVLLVWGWLSSTSRYLYRKLA